MQSNETVTEKPTLAPVLGQEKLVSLLKGCSFQIEGESMYYFKTRVLAVDESIITPEGKIVFIEQHFLDKELGLDMKMQDEGSLSLECCNTEQIVVGRNIMSRYHSVRIPLSEIEILND